MEPRSYEAQRQAATKHGLNGHKLQGIWAQMRQRCTNEKHRYYKNYGGSGVAVCREWGEFTGFYTWAMESGYTDGMVIKRKDREWHYTPDNCFWGYRRKVNG